MKSEIFFQTTLLSWYLQHGRHDLPWQHQSPYHVWLSEIMLQQTQVATVIPYFERFISKFENVFDLANASLDDVLLHWAGLGYYHRAKNLHRCAQMIVQDHQGRFPQNLDTLMALPGIGPSTAAAIASQAFNLPYAILDGNVMRVLSRFFGIEASIHLPTTKKNLQTLANNCMPHTQCQAYTQAIMDMGATCCKPKNPKCGECPLHQQCYAFQHQKVETIPLKEKKLTRKIVRWDFTAFINPQHEIWLEQRPHEGIWPKLWCLPEEYPSEVIAHCYHDLTHMRMDIHVSLKKVCLLNREGRWVSAWEISKLALPKPLTKLITKVFLALES